MRASTALFLIVCALLAIGLAMAANDGIVIPVR